MTRQRPTRNATVPPAPSYEVVHDRVRPLGRWQVRHVAPLLHGYEVLVAGVGRCASLDDEVGGAVAADEHVTLPRCRPEDAGPLAVVTPGPPEGVVPPVLHAPHVERPVVRPQADLSCARTALAERPETRPTAAHGAPRRPTCAPCSPSRRCGSAPTTRP